MQPTIEMKQSELLSSLRYFMHENDSCAKRLEWWVNLYKRCFLVLALLAAFGGFLANVELVKKIIIIEPWMISILVMSSGGLLQITQRTRIKSNIFYECRDRADKLIHRIVYEMPTSLNADQIATISKEFVGIKKVFGEKIKEFNNQELEDIGRIGKVEKQ